MMKKIYKSKILMFTIATFFTMSCLNQVLTRKVYANSNVQELLITEIMPMSQTSNDAYEYIELYNNSDRNIDLKDYKLPLQNMDITTSKIISPKGILVVCTKGSTTLDSFNTFYGTALTADKYITLPFIDEVLSNNSTTTIKLSKDDDTIIVNAQYYATDFQAKRGVTYKYAETGYDMLRLGLNQSPTPGSVSSEQVPQNVIKVTGITLDKTSITMEVNQSAILKATVSPTTAANKNVVWTSGNPSIVEVNQSGVLTSKAEGAVYISATTVDGGLTTGCTVIVRKIPVTRITLDKTLISMEANQTAVLQATVAPANATNKTIVWTSNNSSIAEVSQNGIVTSKAEGTTYVTATAADGGLVAVCTIFVKRIPVTGMTLDKTSSIIKVGESISLKPSITPTNATNKLVNFQSSNSNIASVDSNGKVVGKGIGEAVVTATTRDGNYTAVCIITVKNDGTFNIQELLITEVMPMSQANNDDYEYIELYNNSDRNIDLKDYKLPLQNMDITTSKVISPKGVLVVCTKSSTKLEDFNTFYGTALTAKKYTTLPFLGEVISNSSNTSIVISKDNDSVVVRAQCNTTDFQTKKGVTYRYNETGIDMLRLGQNQSPTPGSVSSEQVPQGGIKVTGITLDKTSFSVEVGESVVLIASVTPLNATDKSVSFQSSNRNIASVDSNGKVIGKAIGVATITATTKDGNFKSTCTITVKENENTDKENLTIRLNKKSIQIKQGKFEKLTALITPGNLKKTGLIWTSSNKEVASVSEDGRVFGKKEGTAIITVTTVGGAKASCKVEITSGKGKDKYQDDDDDEDSDKGKGHFNE